MSKPTIGARRAILAVAIGAVMAALSPSALSQVTPAAGYVPPNDTPSFKVGTTLFLDYTYTDSPTAKNADGSTYNPSSFNVGRAYLNFTGQLHHLLSYRVTTDLVRVTDATGTLSGSYAVRVKYAFAQFNMDDWLVKGSWIRLGQQQTPYIDYAEGIYRYRFQYPTMVDKDGFLTSSDLGLSGHFNFPNNFGDVHLGYYNGEGYNHPEANDEKGFQIRASLRPLPGIAVAKGWRVTGLLDLRPASRRARRGTAGSSTRRSSTRTSMSGSRTSRRRTRRRPARRRSSRRTGRSGSRRAPRSASRRSSATTSSSRTRTRTRSRSGRSSASPTGSTSATASSRRSWRTTRRRRSTISLPRRPTTSSTRFTRSSTSERGRRKKEEEEEEIPSNERVAGELHANFIRISHREAAKESPG